jgi:hypothetical protein
MTLYNSSLLSLETSEQLQCQRDAAFGALSSLFVLSSGSLCRCCAIYSHRGCGALSTLLSSVSATTEAAAAATAKAVTIAIAAAPSSSMSMPRCSVCARALSGLPDVIIQALLYIKKTGYIVKFIELETKQQLVFKEGLQLEDKDWTTWSSRVESSLLFIKGQVNCCLCSNKCAVGSKKFLACVSLSSVSSNTCIFCWFNSEVYKCKYQSKFNLSYLQTLTIHYKGLQISTNGYI